MVRKRRSRRQNNAQENDQLHGDQKVDAQPELLVTSYTQQDHIPPLQPAWAAVTASRTRPVDSWRSYREDQSNLQSLLGPEQPTILNAKAPEFEPVPHQSKPNSKFTPYQPLRASNGENEQRVLYQAKLDSLFNSATDVQVSQGSHRQHPRQLGDHVLPSIERPPQDLQGVSTKTQSNSAPSQTRIRGRKSKGPGSRVFNRAMSTQTPEPLPVPSPTEAYKAQAALGPIALLQPQKLLVILDLNGTLLYRNNRACAPTSFIFRPGVHKLLRYLFENHIVMVYTSAQATNAAAMVSKLMSPQQRKLLAAIWARDKLDLNKEQFNNKVQVYKKLGKVWNDSSIQATAGERRCWDQSNTILIDDSHLKALAQPHNLLQVPEFMDDSQSKGGSQAAMIRNKKEELILNEIEQKLEELKWTCDVSRLIRIWQEAEDPHLAKPNLQFDGSTDQPAIKPSEAADLEDNGQLLTPKSPLEKTPNLDEASCGDQAEHVNMHEDIQAGVTRSESPIDESVWSEILGTDDGRKAVETPATPKSISE